MSKIVDKDVIELWRSIRKVAELLRKFLDTEDYSYIEQAWYVCKDIGIDGSGIRDLKSNIDEMYECYRSSTGSIDLDVHGRLVSQATYALVRANIISRGLEFKIKRMRGS